MEIHIHRSPVGSRTMERLAAWHDLWGWMQTGFDVFMILPII